MGHTGSEALAGTIERPLLNTLDCRCMTDTIRVWINLEKPRQKQPE